MSLAVVLLCIVLAFGGLTAILFKLLKGESARNLQALRDEFARSQQTLQGEFTRHQQGLRDEFARNREETAQTSKNLREEINGRLDSIRGTVEQKLVQMSESNVKKLDEMRQTVDEKLQGTLEKRLGESFKLVSDRLEQVHKGLGEMQSLATGVGDLKKVLTNVKARGTWGEIQLGNLLEQMLTPEQFERNVQIKSGSTENVEFAVCLPGKDDSGALVYLPIDSKFPVEDYQRLQEAQDRGDVAAAAESAKMLEVQIKKCARDIRDKYIHPPASTDFGILYLPVESLFAEVLRRPGLAEALQHDFRVTVAGPTTLAATLNALQMGFRSLAIQKRSSEVWKVLGAVKSEFGKFGDILDKVGKKLEEAQNTIGDAASKSRNIERKLKGVEELPSSEAGFLIPGPDAEA
jgi:DNA recombination protein RmuC